MLRTPPIRPRWHNLTWRHLLCAAVLVSGLSGPAAAQTTPHLVVVTGLGGEEPRFDERFHAWAATLIDAAGARYGLPDDRVVYLAADPERDPGRARARSWAPWGSASWGR
ncbi:MAG TPA: hypothetical protein VGG06_20395 [Thermoanaerobaculia bacterium]